MKSAPTIAFDYRPSRAIAAAAAAGVACVLFAIGANDLPQSLRIMLAVAVLVLSAAGLRRFSRPAFRRIAWREAGWVLVDAKGDEHAADLVAQRCLGALVALDFRYAKQARFRPLLTPDNVDADTRRRLVLLLARVEVMRAA